MPAGEVWRDNLGQDAGDASSFVVTWGGRFILGTVSALVIWGFWEDWQRRVVRRSA